MFSLNTILSEQYKLNMTKRSSTEWIPLNIIIIPPVELCALPTNRAGCASLPMVLEVEEEEGREEEEDVECVVRVGLAALE